jgi:hypothetical protein
MPGRFLGELFSNGNLVVQGLIQKASKCLVSCFFTFMSNLADYPFPHRYEHPLHFYPRKKAVHLVSIFLFLCVLKDGRILGTFTDLTSELV